MTQVEMVLEYLRKGNSITPLEALNLFGCFRLADVIFKLKKDGHDIKSEMIHTTNGKYFAQYSMVFKTELF